MVAKLDIDLELGRPRLLPLTLGALAALAILTLLLGPVLLLLAAGVLAGTGVTYFSGLRLQLDERLAYGAVIGSGIFAGLTFLVALLIGLTPVTVAVGSALTVVAGASGWLQSRSQIRRELNETLHQWRRLQPWPLWLLLGVCWPFTIVLLSRAYQLTAQGLLVGNTAIYADWAAHLTFATSFAYGQNFPPQFAIYPGHGLTYPFMVDFWAATLVPLGVPVTSALVLTSGLLGLALPAVVYFAWVRLVGNRVAAAVAVMLFVAGGGLGFLLLAGRSGPLPLLFTQDPGRNLVWLNPVLSWLLPQRSILFGIALVPVGLALLWSARQQASWAPFAFTGLMTGLLPVLHLHAFGTLVAMASFWAFFDLLSKRPRAGRHWGAFFLPAVVAGGPVAIWMASGGAASPHLQPGWMAAADGHNDNWLWFWLWNTGLLVPLLLLALPWPRLLPSGLALRLAPIWLWFLVPNFVVFQPWDWDNTKFFVYWALIGALPVALLLQRLNRRVLGLGVVLFVSLTASGLLDLAEALDQNRNTFAFTDNGGLQAAAWIRDHTDPHAVFLVAPQHNEPVPCLAGRTVVAGYPGWLLSYGLPGWQQRTEQVGIMLQGGPGTAALVRQYHVAYVVIGPQELAYPYRASSAYWSASAQSVYSSDGYTIYRTG